MLFSLVEPNDRFGGVRTPEKVINRRTFVRVSRSALWVRLGTNAALGQDDPMAWNFETDPDDQAQIGWADVFGRDRVERVTEMLELDVAEYS